MRKFTATQFPDRWEKKGEGTIFCLNIKDIQLVRTNCIYMHMQKRKLFTVPIFHLSTQWNGATLFLKFQTACVQWHANLANQGGNSLRNNPSPNRFCLCCHIWRSCGVIAAVLTASNSHPPKLILITITSLNQNLWHWFPFQTSYVNIDSEIIICWTFTPAFLISKPLNYFSAWLSLWNSSWLM